MKYCLIIYFLLLSTFCNVYCNVGDKDTLISIMRECKNLNQNLLNAVQNETQNIILQNKLRHKFEKFYEESFSLNYKLLIDEICKNKDKELLYEYFNLCNSLINCTDETLSEILFRIYICQSDFFIKELIKMPKVGYNLVLKKTQDAFIMNIEGNENQIKDFPLLKSKLFKLALR